MKYSIRTVGLLLTVGILNACSGGGPARRDSTTASGPPVKFLTIGGSATEGDGLADRLREAWPYLVYHDAFGRAATLVNTALDDGTMAGAQSEQLPLVQETKPDVVAIWLGADDLLESTPVGAFTSELAALIQSVRDANTRRILVATLPRSFGPAAPTYNEAIRNVVSKTRSVLVELQNTTVALNPTDGLGPQPDAAGQRTVAEAFERALRSS